jgi:hypothetical protein
MENLDELWKQGSAVLALYPRVKYCSQISGKKGETRVVNMRTCELSSTF